jgi:hypothetical protein
MMTKIVVASLRANSSKIGLLDQTTGNRMIYGIRDLSRASHPASLDQGRKEHLNAPYLSDYVNMGSPKRAPLRCPAWRRSRHISQKLGVIPETASQGWTRKGEIRRAIGGGNPSTRVKGDTLVEFGKLITTRGLPRKAR